MLIPEEVKFNEARQAFEEAYNAIQEAFEAERNIWWQEDRDRKGLTKEKIKMLKEFEHEIISKIPQRMIIIDRIPETLESSEVEAENTDTESVEAETSQSNIVVATEKVNFLTNLLKNIRNLLNRFIGRKKDEISQEIPLEIPEPDDNQDNSSQGLGEIDYTSYNEVFFDIDKIIEECQRTYEELLKASQALDLIYEKRINDSPRGSVIGTKRDGPGILDDYRQGSWGIERICLDGFQNHLPADSKGTQCYLHFKVGGKWVDVDTARLNRDKITEVRFSDNGVGFTADNLFYLHSTKTSEDSSAGQFGEGMKLASIAAVNLGLGLEFQSRNWTAIATSEEKKIINTRKNDEAESRKKLVYDVSVYDGEPIIGSRTIFHTPTPEFIDYALTLPEKVMRIGEIGTIASTDDVELLDFPESGKAFVKGIYLKDFRGFFSYNFKNANVNPDRNDFHNYDEESVITRLFAKTKDIDLIERYILHIVEHVKTKGLNEGSWIWAAEHPAEFGLSYRILREIQNLDEEKEKETKLMWKTAFERALSRLGMTSKDGKQLQPVLKTDYQIPEYLQGTLEDYAVIELANGWTDFFKKIGVPTDRQIIPEFTEETLETSLSLDYGKNIWDAQRIVLDASQNHLPTDTKGTAIFLRFRTKDGMWHDYREFDKFSDDEIERIKISDNGVGYDFKNLGLFASVKDHSDSSGKWGEGLKMLSAAALRAGVRMELRSRDWIAIPGTKEETLNEGQQNEKKIERLIYTVRKRIDPDSKVLDDGEDRYKTDYGFSKNMEVSSTTFLDPTPELIREFRNIRDSVLLFSPRTPIATSKDSDILAASGGQLFVRNILIPGEHQLKYSYHLKSFDIETRDRDVIKRDSMKEKMQEILENIDDEKFIEIFLSDAAKSVQGFDENDLIEFSTRFYIPPESELAEKWIRVFKKKFGENTSIRSASDIDFNAVHQAQHLGLDMVTLPETVAYSLMEIRGKDDQRIPSYRDALRKALESTIPVSEEELTDKEKAMLEHLYKYNKILELGGHGTNPIEKIRVFDYPPDYTGTRAGGFASMGNVMNVSRETLNNGVIEAGHVFFHESGHNITGAEDADKAFRDYLSMLLSRIAFALTPFEESIIDNGVAKDISIEDIMNALNSLSKILSKSTVQKTEGEEYGDE